MTLFEAITGREAVAQRAAVISTLQAHLEQFLEDDLGEKQPLMYTTLQHTDSVVGEEAIQAVADSLEELLEEAKEELAAWNDVTVEMEWEDESDEDQ